MALWRNSTCRMAVLLASTSLAVGIAGPAAADFPGERWSVDYVKVNGGADPALAAALNQGLTSANQIYFYGDRATRMDATIAGGSVDLRILDAASGAVIAERPGLPFDAGDPAGSIRAAALAWMEGLGCVDGCALAKSGVVEQPVVAVAQAEPAAVEPAATTPAEPTVADPADPVAVTEDPEPGPEPVEIAQTDPEPNTSAPTSAEIAAILTAPSAGSTAESALQGTAPAVALAEAPSASAPSLSQPSLAAVSPSATPSTPAPSVQGLDADQVLAEAPSASAPSLSQPNLAAVIPSATPSTPAPSVQGLDADQVLAEAPSASAPSLSQPNLAAVSPAATPSTPAPSVQGLDADQVLAEAARGEAAQPAQPAVSGAPAAAVSDQAISLRLPDAPSTGQVGAASPAQTGQLSVSGAPSADVATGTAPALVTAAQPEPEVTAPTIPATPTAEATAPTSPSTAEAALQEVSPGVSLPQPGTQVAASPLAPRTEEAPTAANTGDDLPDTGAALTAQAPATPDIQAPTAEVTQELATAAPADDPAPATPAATPQPVVTEPAVSDPTPAVTEPEPPATEPEPAVTEPAVTEPTGDDLDGTVLALANPSAPVAADPLVTDPPAADEPATATVPDPTPAQPQSEAEPGTTVETQVAAIDPDAGGPTLANARWVGFTPAVYTGSDTRTGTWISGPFDRKQRTGWITDTATGATTRVKFIWREGGQGGRTAILSREAARALGLGQGDVANVAVYLPR